MNKNQMISKARKALEVHQILEGEDYIVSLQGPSVILTISGGEKMTDEIKEEIQTLRVTVIGHDGGKDILPVIKNDTVLPTESSGKPEASEEFKIRSKIEVTLTNSLEVFIKKYAARKKKKMGPCASVIFTKLADIGPTGTNVIGVKKPGSSRIFYTTEDRLPQPSIQITETLTEVIE
jgi:hypothetical protein